MLTLGQLHILSLGANFLFKRYLELRIFRTANHPPSDDKDVSSREVVTWLLNLYHVMSFGGILHLLWLG